MKKWYVYDWMIHEIFALFSKSNIEVPYYSSKIFKEVCISCGIENQLMPSDDIHFPQCHNCPSERVKRNKRKQVLSCDLNANKKQKTLV